WLRKTKRKAMLAALEKIREELMLLGVISLLLSQTARFISEICVPSSLFTSRFYICSESDYQDLLRNTDANQTALDKNMFGGQRLHVCGEGHEPFVSYEGLEQLHRFLFILGITHVLYSFVTVVLSMIKIYSWRKWETLAGPIAAEELKARRTKVMRRQSTFVFNNASHPWSKNKILIWMLCFLRQFKGSIIRSDYLALRLGFVTYHKLPHSYDFHKYMVRSMEDDYNGTIGISWPLWAYAIVCILINVHGINIYFWLSFVPVILVLLVGTELQHVIAQLALEVAEATAPYVGSQLKLRDDLFWFGKPRVLWWLIQFISFQDENIRAWHTIKVVDVHYMLWSTLKKLLIHFWYFENNSIALGNKRVFSFSQRKLKSHGKMGYIWDARMVEREGEGARGGRYLWKTFLIFFFSTLENPGSFSLHLLKLFQAYLALWIGLDCWGILKEKLCYYKSHTSYLLPHSDCLLSRKLTVLVQSGASPAVIEFSKALNQENIEKVNYTLSGLFSVILHPYLHYHLDTGSDEILSLRICKIKAIKKICIEKLNMFSPAE
ncbi:hypothetical protein ACJX0J_022198, partial [Zea mays]